MIVFLTLSYCILLFLLVKFNIIKLTKFWQLSPAIFLLLLIILLFIPMQFWAPESKDLRIYGRIISITPRVYGKVLEVPVQPNTPLNTGDILFRIDPEPYQNTVDQLKAALAQAEQGVPQLKTIWEGSIASREKATAALTMAQKNYKRKFALWKEHTISTQEFDHAQSTLDESEAALEQAKASEEKAKLAFESDIDGTNTGVAELKAQLNNAELQKSDTIVRAPSKGYVLNIQLRPGAIVGKYAISSPMTFVDTSQAPNISMLVKQNMARKIKAGDSAEVAFDYYPGKIFPAKVKAVLRAFGEGQLAPSGDLPTTATSPPPGRIGVTLEMDPNLLPDDIPLGASGSAAIYTQYGKPTHIIRKVMIRMDSFMDYLF